MTYHEIQESMRAYREASAKARAHLKAFEYKRATDPERLTARAIARALCGLPVDRTEREAIRAAGLGALVD